VQTLFTIISPTTRAHLHLMSKLSFVLRDEGVRRVVRQQESRQEILDQIARAEKRLVTPDETPSLTPVGDAPSPGRSA
jgi:PTS system nitrogen regulatory IIA component